MARELKPLTDEDIAACEPEAIWLETRKVPIPAHTVMWLLCLLLAGALAWACLAKVDRIVVAEGKLVTTRPNVTLKPLENSLVREVLVRPGQRVKKGDVLISFDPTVNQAELRNQQQQHDSKLCEVLRLEAEFAEAQNYKVPEGLQAGKDDAEQQQLFASRREYVEGRNRYFAQYIERYSKMADSLESSLAMYEERLKSMERIEEMYRKLEEKHMVAVKDVLEVQMQRLANEIEIENQRASLVEYRQMLHQCEAERDVFHAEWRQQIAQQLVEARRELIGYAEGVKKYSLLAQQTEMLAPCDAVVHEIAPFQEGSGVREAEALVTLIPTGVPLEAEIDIQPQDVGRLRVGDEVKLKLDAFPFQQHGTLKGELLFISADTYESRSNLEEGADPATASMPRPQYRARVAVSGSLKGVDDATWQAAGMKLRSEIKVGERTVMSYLLNPFLKAMDESIREP